MIRPGDPALWGEEPSWYASRNAGLVSAAFARMERERVPEPPAETARSVIERPDPAIFAAARLRRALRTLTGIRERERGGFDDGK